MHFILHICVQTIVFGRRKLRSPVSMECSACIAAPAVYVVQEIYKDRKKFSRAVFEVASSDLINMGISVVSYTLKDLKDDEVS